MSDKIDLYDMLSCLENSPYQDERAVIDSYAGILLPGYGGVGFFFDEETTLFSRKHKGLNLRMRLQGDAPSYTVFDLAQIVAGALQDFPEDQYAAVLCKTPDGYVGPLGGDLYLEETGEPGHFFLHGSAVQISTYTGSDYVPA